MNQKSSSNFKPKTHKNFQKLNFLLFWLNLACRDTERLRRRHDGCKGHGLLTDKALYRRKFSPNRLLLIEDRDVSLEKKKHSVHTDRRET